MNIYIRLLLLICTFLLSFLSCRKDRAITLITGDKFNGDYHYVDLDLFSNIKLDFDKDGEPEFAIRVETNHYFAQNHNSLFVEPLVENAFIASENRKFYFIYQVGIYPSNTNNDTLENQISVLSETKSGNVLWDTSMAMPILYPKDIDITKINQWDYKKLSIYKENFVEGGYVKLRPTYGIHRSYDYSYNILNQNPDNYIALKFVKNKVTHYAWINLTNKFTCLEYSSR